MSSTALLKSLSLALKGVRRHRKLTVLQIANSMGLSKRTYEEFEAGRTGLRLDRLEAFARATDSDPHAILISAWIGTPDFAAACAETKAISLLLSALGRAHTDLGGVLAYLTARDVAAAFGAAFTDLIAAGEARRARSQPISKTCDTQALSDTPPDPTKPSDPDRRGS